MLRFTSLSGLAGVVLGALVMALPPCAAPAAAQGTISIDSVYAGADNLSSPDGLFAGHLSFVVTVTSTNPVAGVTATFAGRTLPLQVMANGETWRGSDLTTASLPYGLTAIEIRATDTIGNSVATQLTRIHDNPPTVEILAPAPNVLARPNARIHARCTDDGGPCRISIDALWTVPAATNVLTEIDQVFSLEPMLEVPGLDTLAIRATDAMGQQAVVRQPIWVEPSPRLSLVASFPGVIQDIDTGRALVFTNDAPSRALIVDRLTGAVQTLFSTPPSSNPFGEGQLTPSGALFTVYENGGHQLYDWAAGVITPLGRVDILEQFVGRIRVEGTWALYNRQRPGSFGNTVYDLVRRDLLSGVEVLVVDGSTSPNWTADIAANGDVVFRRSGANFRYDLVRYRDGEIEPIVVGAGNLNGARTDGTIVAYEASTNSSYACGVHTPAGSEILAQNSTSFVDVYVREGWAVCKMAFSPYQTWTRNPTGVRQLVPVPNFARIDGIGEDGGVLYRQTTGSGYNERRYLRRGTAAAIDVGRAKWRLQREDGIWYVFAGPHLLRIVGRESLLSEGSTGAFFDEQLTVLNPSAASGYASLHILKAGEVQGRPLTIPARSQQTIRVADEPGMASASASAAVYSDIPLVVERTMTWDASAYGGHSASAVDGPRRRWLFAEGAQGYFDTFILLVNDDAAPATVQLRFLVEQGANVLRTLTLPGQSRMTVYAGTIAELANSSFATIVEASIPIGAERAMYFGAGWTGGHGSAGVAQAATRWFHAEGATGSVFDTFILLANPNAEPASAVVTFLTTGGATVARTVALPPFSRRTINPETVDPLLAATSFATSVQADRPIVSERAMYWSTAAGGWQEAHNSFGVTTTGTKWGTSDGRVGGPRGYFTYVLVANTSATATANLLATFYRSDGVQVTRTMTVGPNRRFNIDCNSIPELADAEFGVVVESTNAVPIVVERATYWNAGGILWAGGTNVTATPVP